jgi:hypothetical protein
MNDASMLDTAGAAMWQLVERHTGRVGYGRGIKAEGLTRDSPVIDCSGWTILLLSTAMTAANQASGRDVFSADAIGAIDTWSDRIIEVIEARTGHILTGDRLSAETLPRFATIGLRQGGGAWAANHPRPRGITHVVQIVRRPSDGAAFVSEAQGWAAPCGLRLMPLAEWLHVTRDYLREGEAWAVDPFAVAAPR